MAGFGATIDPLEDDSANVELTLTDGTTNGIGYRLIGLTLPTATLKTVYASSFDTEGDLPAAEHAYGPGEMIVKLRVTGTSDADLKTRLDSLSQKQAKLNREQGSIKITMPDDTKRFYDITEASGGGEITQGYSARQRTQVDLTFKTRPFWRGTEVGNLTDDYSLDTITSGAWALDTGGGTLSVTGGQLVPSSTAEKRLYRTDRTFYDVEFTHKVTTGSTLTSLVFGTIGKRIDASNFAYARINGAGGATGLQLYARNAGSDGAALASGTFTPATSTSYWLRIRVEGNKLTAEVFTAAPAPSTVPTATCTATLTAGNATAFGRGVKGGVGLRLVPAATGERYDDAAAMPNVYVERALPALITEPIYGVEGDVHARVRNLVDEMDGDDQWWGAYGRQTRYVDTASTAALLYEAESLTPMGTAAIATVSGASGGGSNNVVTEASLSTNWGSMLSTQGSGGGAHLTHVDDFHAWARLYMPTTNTGQVSARLDWAVGDFYRVTSNDGIVFDADHNREGQFVLVDLGIVNIGKVITGAQRWEGRIVAKSTVSGDALSVDCLMLFPTESYAEFSAPVILATPTVLTARDPFDQSSGNLGGKTAAVGGLWITAGVATDFTVDSITKTITRPVFNQTDWRFAVPTTPANAATMAGQIDFKFDGLGTGTGVNQHAILLRYSDTSNYAALYADPTDTGMMIYLIGKVAGTPFTVGGPIKAIGSLTGSTWYTLRAHIDSKGRVVAWCGPQGVLPTTPQFASASAVVASLPNGKPGFADRNLTIIPSNRSYDNFMAYVPTTDAVLFANRQLQLRTDSLIRQDSSGTFWNRVTRGPSGRYMTLPPAGRENRTSRIILKCSEGLPATMPDPAIDDLRCQVLVTPRYLSVS